MSAMQLAAAIALCAVTVASATHVRTPADAGGSGRAAAPLIGLDHIPLVVRDLVEAAQRYRRLGFALKPGRPHANGIVNAHVKFEDGAGVELITAPAAADELTAHYRALMDAAEGPVFFGLHARDTERFAEAMRRAGIPFDGSDGQLGTPGLEYVLVVRDNRSPTDRPDHFAHPNGATGLVRVWLAPDNPAALRRFLEAAGGSTTMRTVSVPERADATIVRVANGEVVILPTAHRVTPGRPIIGVTFSVRSLGDTAAYLANAGVHGDASPGPDGARVLIAPAEARGMWIEFRQTG